MSSPRTSTPSSSSSGSGWRSLPGISFFFNPLPSCPRRVLCENSGTMALLGLPMFRDAKTSCMFLGVLIISYYIVMDIILFMRFRNVNIVEDSKPGPPDEMYSPFTHLSVKALMNDHTSQYIISPSAEYFDMFTKFSTTFTFITPNVISFTHLFLALLSGKFVASENLYDRRIGVLIFQVRTWLDAFDGVVYRSQSNTHLQFQSVRSTIGYYVDTNCDVLGGVFLCFGILFYLWKRFDPYKQELPSWNKTQEATISKPGMATNGHHSTGNGRGETYSKKYVFWKVLCFGLALAAAGKCWDLIVGDFRLIFQEDLKNPQISVLQFQMCHSSTAMFLFYMWRVLEGQAVLQYFLIPIFLDKVWEFLNYTQYILLGIIVGLYIVSLIYVQHVRTALNL